MNFKLQLKRFTDALQNNNNSDFHPVRPRARVQISLYVYYYSTNTADRTNHLRLKW